MIACIQPKDKFNQLYIVANTHLNFNSNRGDIKLAELKTLTDAIAQLKEYFSVLEERKVAVIICGDFNSTSRSGVYEFIRGGSHDCLKLDKYTISGQVYGNYANNETPPSISFEAAVKNLGQAPKNPLTMGGKDLEQLVEWYTEIVNTEV